MPEVELAIRWADGHVQAGTSPSTAIERWLVQSAVYPRDELAHRVRHGLAEASERVREVYGYACTSAAQLTDELLHGAAVHGVAPDAPGTVERLRRVAAPPSSPTPPPLPERVEVVVIGGGQAGLTASWYLGQNGIEHVVLERDRIAGSWRRERWDSFCLVTPNFQCRLPGVSVPRHRNPRGSSSATRSSTTSSRSPPRSRRRCSRGSRSGRSAATVPRGFVVQTSSGELHADQVVLAVGGYHRPRLPAAAARPAGGDHPAALVGLPQSVVAARRRRARRRLRAVRGADRRGPAAGRSRRPPVGRLGAAGGAPVPGARLRVVAGGHRPLRHADRRSPAGSRPPDASPTTTSPDATAGATSTCARTRWPACSCTAGSATRATGC